MRRKDREVTDIGVIKEILDSCMTVCVSMIDNDRPYSVPLNYGYEIKDRCLILYLHSAKEGRKIDILKRNNKVCFTIFSEGEPVHAETPCSSGFFYSSVFGEGEACFIEDMSEKKHALKVLTSHQMKRDYDFTDEQADSVCVFKIVSTGFTGKRKPKT